MKLLPWLAMKNASFYLIIPYLTNTEVCPSTEWQFIYSS